MAWLTGWAYRKEVTLSRASGAVTDYQMKVLIGESSGAVGEDIDCGGHCASTFNDIRFTASDGETLLDYWIESISGTTPNQLATVWVEFDSIDTSATTFYMYYGKADAAAGSNGVNTFIVFDDFERGSNGDSISGDAAWTIWGTVTISTSQAYGGSRSAQFRGNATLPQCSRAATASGSISVRFRVYKDGTSDFLHNHGDGTTRCILRLEADEDISVFDGATYVDKGNITANAWHLYELNNWDWTNKTVDVWYDEAKLVDNCDISYTNSSIANLIHFYNNVTTTTSYTWLDDVIVRNWLSVEPAWGSWGAEATSSYPGGIDPYPTDVASGDNIPSLDWNVYSTAACALESKIGVNDSTVNTSLDWKLFSAGSYNPGHKHTELYDSNGILLVDNSRTSDTFNASSVSAIWVDAVKYIFPASIDTRNAYVRYDPATTSLILSADDSQSPGLVVPKSSDETVTNSTLQNDNVLKFDVEASAFYRFEVFLLTEGNSAFDIKMNYDVPAGGAMYWHTLGTSYTAEAATGGTPGVAKAAGETLARGLNTLTEEIGYYVSGVYVGGANSGTVTLQWAQNSTGATGTTVKEGSMQITQRLD